MCLILFCVFCLQFIDNLRDEFTHILQPSHVRFQFQLSNQKDMGKTGALEIAGMIMEKYRHSKLII